MKTRYWFILAALLPAAAATAAPPASTSKAPAAAVKPCPQGMMGGQGPAEPGMPCAAMQGMPRGPHAGPDSGMNQRGPAAASKSAASGAQQVYGWQLMTPQERMDFQAKMRAAKTPEERAALRADNHRKMQARAKQQGVTLPEVPPP